MKDISKRIGIYTIKSIFKNNDDQYVIGCKVRMGFISKKHKIYNINFEEINILDIRRYNSSLKDYEYLSKDSEFGIVLDSSEDIEKYKLNKMIIGEELWDG